MAPHPDWQSKVEGHLSATYIAAAPVGADEAERRLRALIAKLLRGAGVRKRVSQDDLLLIIDDQYVKTTFEISPRWPHEWPDEWEKKSRLERTMFKGYDDGDRHITYGYPTQSDDELLVGPEHVDSHVLAGYGKVVLTLDSRALKNVTATLCDSGWITKWATRHEVAASHFRRPHWTSARRVIGWVAQTWEETIRITSLNTHPTDYAELQIHESVRTSAIVAAHILEPVIPAVKDFVATSPRIPFDLYGPGGVLLVKGDRDFSHNPLPETD